MLTEKEIVKEYLRRRLDRKINQIKNKQRKGIILEDEMWKNIAYATEDTNKEIDDLRLYYID